MRRERWQRQEAARGGAGRPAVGTRSRAGPRPAKVQPTLRARGGSPLRRAGTRARRRLTSIAAGSPSGSSQVIQAEQEGKGRGESKILDRRSRAVTSQAADGDGCRGSAGARGGGGGRWASGRSVQRRLSVSDCRAGHQCSLLSKVHQQSQ